MTPPSDDKSQFRLRSIRPIKWLMLSVALSIAGSILITLAIGAIDVVRSGAANASARAYVHPSLDLLYYFAFYSLIINLLGAIFLIAFFAIQKRLWR